MWVTQAVTTMAEWSGVCTYVVLYVMQWIDETNRTNKALRGNTNAAREM